MVRFPLPHSLPSSQIPSHFKTRVVFSDTLQDWEWVTGGFRRGRLPVILWSPMTGRQRGAHGRSTTTRSRPPVPWSIRIEVEPTNTVRDGRWDPSLSTVLRTVLTPHDSVECFLGSEKGPSRVFGKVRTRRGSPTRDRPWTGPTSTLSHSLPPALNLPWVPRTETGPSKYPFERGRQPSPVGDPLGSGLRQAIGKRRVDGRG